MRGFIYINTMKSTVWLGIDGRWTSERRRVSYTREYFDRHCADKPQLTFVPVSDEVAFSQDRLAEEIETEIEQARGSSIYRM